MGHQQEEVDMQIVHKLNVIIAFAAFTFITAVVLGYIS